MPSLTSIHIALVVIAMIVGLLVGWVFRGSRSTSEKTAINAGWQ